MSSSYVPNTGYKFNIHRSHKEVRYNKTKRIRTEKSCLTSRLPSFKTFLDNHEINDLLKKRKSNMSFLEHTNSTAHSHHCHHIEGKRKSETACTNYSKQEKVFENSDINCMEESKSLRDLNLNSLSQKVLIPETATFKCLKEKYINNPEAKFSLQIPTNPNEQKKTVSDKDRSLIEKPKDIQVLSFGCINDISVRRITNLELTSNLCNINIIIKKEQKKELKVMNDTSMVIKAHREPINANIISDKENIMLNVDVIDKAIYNIQNGFKELLTERSKKRNRKRYRYTMNNKYKVSSHFTKEHESRENLTESD